MSCSCRVVSRVDEAASLLLCSICGGMLLVGGLYCVLWGKKKEVENEADKGATESKEETQV